MPAFRHPSLLVLALAALLLAGALFVSLRSDRAPQADAHAPHPGLDFSIAADVNSDGTDDCSTRTGQPTTCVAPQGGPFVVNEYLDSLGDIPAFRNMQLHFGYDAGVQPAADPQMVWPGCTGAVISPFPGYTHVTCGVAPSAPSVVYTGLVGKSYFTCASDGSLNLMHGLLPYHTYLSDPDAVRHAEDQQTMEMLDVTCATPQTYPTDTDADGCPDTKEADSTPGLGGVRNFFNPWDYFNPSHDGMNRIDDILLIAHHFGKRPGDIGYDPAYDRTYVGPNAWNLGPPDGLISIADILSEVKQYNHNCS